MRIHLGQTSTSCNAHWVWMHSIMCIECRWTGVLYTNMFIWDLGVYIVIGLFSGVPVRSHYSSRITKWREFSLAKVQSDTLLVQCHTHLFEDAGIPFPKEVLSVPVWYMCQRRWGLLVSGLPGSPCLSQGTPNPLGGSWCTSKGKRKVAIAQTQGQNNVHLGIPKQKNMSANLERHHLPFMVLYRSC